jgi:hypothetical protein
VSHQASPLREEPVELPPQWHRVDGHGIVAIDIENTDLQERAIGRRADQHRQVVVHLDPTHRVANGVQDVRVTDAMLPAGSPIRI